MDRQQNRQWASRVATMNWMTHCIGRTDNIFKVAGNQCMEAAQDRTPWLFMRPDKVVDKIVATI